MVPKNCPHLGLFDETVSHFNYPSTRNRCWRLGEPELVEPSHQETYCLTEDYFNCPIYNQPEPVSTKFLFFSRKRIVWIVSIPFLLLFLLLVFFAFTRFFSDPYSLGDKIQGWVTLYNNFNPVQITEPAVENATETITKPTGATSTPNSEEYPITNSDDNNIVQEIYPKNITHVQGINVSVQVVTQGDDEQLPVVEGAPEGPYAYQIQIDGTNDIRIGSIYSLSIEDQSIIKIDDQTIFIFRTDPAYYIQKGPGFQISIENIQVNPSVGEIVEISKDGKRIEFEVRQPKEISVFMGYEEGGVQYQFAIRNVTTTTNDRIAIVVDLDQGQIELHPGSIEDGTYGVEIARVSPLGNQIFLHSEIPFNSFDIQYLLIDSFLESDFLTVKIDHQNNGTIDDIIAYENIANQFYLPMLIFNEE